MPDVGILQLQIQDNSKQAASGLRSLSRALDAVKKSVSGGLRLSGVATQVEKLSKAVSSGITPDLTNKINMLADAVRNLREASAGFEMPNLRGVGGRSGSRSGGGSFEDAQRAMENVRESIGEAQSGFHDVESVVEETTGKVGDLNNAINETNQLVQSTAWQAGGAAEALNEALDAWIRFRAARSLGDGGPKEDVKANLPGYIYAEGTVTSDAELPDVEPVLRLTDGLEDAREAAEGATNAYRYYAEVTEDTPLLMGSIGTPGAANSAWESTAQSIDDLLENSTKIDLIRQKMEALREKMVDGANSGKLNSGQIANLALQYKRLEEQLEKLLWVQRQLEELSNKPFTVSYGDEGGGTGNSDFWDNRSDSYITGRYQFHQTPTSTGNNNVAEQLREDTEFVDNLLQNGSKIDTLEMKMESLRDRMIEGVNSGKMNGSQLAALASQYQNLSDKVETLKNATEESESAIDKIKNAIGGFGDSIKKMFPGLTGFGKQMMRIAKYRFIRAIIKEISDGFREGVENVYRYSKAIGSSFSEKMDSAAASLQMMKNAIGASVAPLIQSLIPYLETVVNWFISMVNYLNQFLSLLRGQSTWTRPIKASANAFDDVKNSAQGASAAMKDLLADWDELNIIQSENNGGGGGAGLTAMTDYLSMFEEVERFDSAVKRIVDFIKDNMDDILKLVKAVGVALLAWKISSSVSDILSKVVGGIAVSALEFFLVFDGVKSLITDGFSWGAFGEAVVGFLTGVFGLWKITGSWKAGLAIGTALAVVATLSAIKVAREESYAEMARKAFTEGGENGLDPDELMKALQDHFNEVTKDNTLVINAFSGADDVKLNLRGLIAEVDNLNNAMFGSKAPKEADVEKFKETWRQIFTAMDDLSSKDFSTIFAGLTDAFNSASKEISDKAKDIRADMLMVQEGISKEYANLRVEIEDLTAKIATGRATPEEIEQYFADLQTIADGQRTALKSLENFADEAGDIDFSSAEAAVTFVSDVGAKANAAIEESKQARAAAVSAAENEMSRLKALYDNGRIGKEAYDSYMASFNEYIDLMNGAEDEKLKEITGTTSDLYMRVLDQAISTLLTSDDYKNANKGEISSYVSTIIQPIIDAIAESPGAIDPAKLENLKKLPQTLIGIASDTTGLGRDIIGHYALGWIDSVFGTEITEKTAEDWRDRFVETLDKVANDEPITVPIKDPFYIDMDAPVDEGIVKDGEAAQKIVDDLKNLFHDDGTSFMDDWANSVLGGGETDIDYEIDTSDLDGASAQAIDTSELTSGMANAAQDVAESVGDIREDLESLDGLKLSFDLTTWGRRHDMSGGYTHGSATMRASGGFVRSGDLVMANENGNFEMMGRMGNQPVVANNQQIVDGISSGVAQANGGLDARMSNIETLLNRILQKEFTAKAVPDSSWGRHAARSAEQYSKVTG